MHLGRICVLIMMIRFFTFIFFVTIVHVSGFAQQNPNIGGMRNELIQLSGIVMNTDSSEGLPLVSVSIKNSSKGTLADETGYFSLVIKRTDTVVFSFIGYKTKEFVLPSSVSGIKYSLLLALEEDPIYLKTAVIRSYPTPDEFNYYFVKANVADQYYKNSSYNLRQNSLQQIARSMSMDGPESQRYLMQQQAYRYYYNGQLPPNRIFDPLAWGQFFRAWQRGDYKKK